MLFDDGQAAVAERVGDLVAREQPHGGQEAGDPLGRSERPSVVEFGAHYQQRYAAAWGEDADDLVERLPGLLEQVQRAKAADRVEALLAERQRGGVAAHVGRVRALGLARREGEHRRGGVDAHDQPGVAGGGREVACEVARPASYVEHPRAVRERQHLKRDAVLPTGPGGFQSHQQTPGERP